MGLWIGVIGWARTRRGGADRHEVQAHMTNDFITAIGQLSAEKNLEANTVLAAVEAAMASALKQEDLEYAELEVKIDADSGDIKLWRTYEVMDDDEIEDDELQMSPERAARMGFPGAEIGDTIREPVPETPTTGRIAAQTAKQVVLQRLREAEREVVFDEYTGKEGELVSGTVLRVEGAHRQVIVDLGRTEALLPAAEQVRPEHYRVGQRLRVYVKEVYRASKGPQVVVSRSQPELLRRLFELEVPEVARGVVEIMAIARDPGYRAKVAVISRQEGVDPIGACVGVRGARIENIVNELGGERVDLIRWDPDDAAFVANALSPAEVVSIRLDEETNTAFVAVPDKQVSLAIGKEGQNARLAANLTRRRIEIKGEGLVMQDGEDLYPPPEPNMEAIPLPDSPGTPALPAVTGEVAPSQADYARPGLPGERVADDDAPSSPEEERTLTPEQEAVAGLEEEPAAATAPEAAAAEAPAAEPAEPAAPAAPAAPADRPAATGGLRFAEDIGEVRALDDEEAPAAARPPRGRRRGRRGPAAERTTPQPQSRRARRHFEVEDEDIDEGLGEVSDEEEIDDQGDEADAADSTAADD